MIRKFIVGLGIALELGCGGKAKPAEPPRRPVPSAPLPAKAYAHYLRGRLALMEGDYRRAVIEFREAAKLARGEAPIRVALIEALFRAGRTRDAEDEARRARMGYPYHSDVWLISGRLLGSLSRWKEAVPMFKRAVELDPTNHAAYLALAGGWVALDQLRKAQKTYLALLARDRESVPANYRLAELYLASRQYAKAASHARRALESDPDHTRARVALARALRKLGRTTESVEALRSAFDRSGGDADVAAQLFRQLLEADERAAAVSMLRDLDRDDLPVATRVSFGYLYLHIHERRAALALARRLLVRHPKDAGVRLLKAQALAELRQRRAAVAVALSIESSSALYATSRAMAAELLARLGDHRRALELATKAHQLLPRNTDLISALALVHELRGAPEKARAVLDAALAQHPKAVELLYTYAAMEDRLGNWQRGLALMEKVLRIDPQHADALNWVGYTLADHGRSLGRAEKLIRRSVELSPGNGYVLDSLGWVLHRRGKHARAERVLWRAARLAPKEPEIYWHLAEVALARKQRNRAQKLLFQARKLGPEGRIRTRIEARIRALGGGK